MFRLSVVMRWLGISILFFKLQICLCNDEYLFLGSRLGNSLLLRFTEKDQNTVIDLDELEEREKGNVQYLNVIATGPEICSL